MKTTTLILLGLMAFSGFSNAQLQIQQKDSPEDKKPLKEKLYTGGNLGLTFGSYTNIMISPILGVMWSPKIHTGLGIEYNYTKDKRYERDFTYHNYGGRVYAQYYLVPQLFAHSELVGLSLERYTQLDPDIKQRHFVPFIYLGGGYRQQLSGRSFVSFRVLFDVLQHEYSPYQSGEPYYTVGFGVGL
jgi:hypothetical protein